MSDEPGEDVEALLLAQLVVLLREERLACLAILGDEADGVFQRMVDSKEPREFEVARRAREVGIGGSGLELTLRNNLNQRALARECDGQLQTRAAPWSRPCA